MKALHRTILQNIMELMIGNLFIIIICFNFRKISYLFFVTT